jgi:hypothetical protein
VSNDGACPRYETAEHGHPDPEKCSPENCPGVAAYRKAHDLSSDRRRDRWRVLSGIGFTKLDIAELREFQGLCRVIRDEDGTNDEFAAMLDEIVVRAEVLVGLQADGVQYQ